MSIIPAQAHGGTGLVVQLKQCKDLQIGKRLHFRAMETFSYKSKYVATALITMYSRCGAMQEARKVFESMALRDVVAWTALILGYVENGESLTALDMFNSIDCKPDRVTFVAALKACAALAAEGKVDRKICLQNGVKLHQRAREYGFDKNLYVLNTLMDMYSKCGYMKTAREVFEGMKQRDTISWNVLILGYVENGNSSLALDMFHSMDRKPERITVMAALKACGSLGGETKQKLDKLTCLHKGKAIHEQARELGLDKELSVSNTLIDMYSKCGDTARAREVFETMVRRDVVSWNALILGYVENGESSIGLDMFNCLDCSPDCVTFVAALKACASLGALEIGQRIHDQVCERGMEQDEMVSSSLVDFYGKCGLMASAEDVFNRMRSRDIVAWTALIGGYSLLGDTSRVFSLVKRMQEDGLQLNSVTVLLILSACNHAGMVEQGQRYFNSISRYAIIPTLGHYTCMVDMLGKANRLQEAFSLVRDMPFEADSHLWMTLLEACRKWRNLDMAKVAFNALVMRNDKQHVAAAYVLMQSLYERLGMVEESAEMESMRKRCGSWEKPGKSWWCDAQGSIIHTFGGET